MIWRRWLVRGLVFSLLGAIAVGAWLFLAYTDPAHVRLLVQERLGVRFNRVAVSLDSARMRLLGGVLVNELRLSRSDALGREAFLYVPSAVLLHDKEHLLDGKMLIRRVEMTRPQLRIVRTRDGAVNLAGILAPSAPSNERLPTVVVRGGTVIFEDQQIAPGIALLELHDVNLTLVNDPPPTLEIEGGGRSDVLGAVRIKATMPRDGGAVSARVELPDIPVGPALIGRLALAVPEAGRHLDKFTARAAAHVELSYDPARAGPFACAAAINLVGGTLEHPALPGKLEGINLSATSDGKTVPSASLSARWGDAKLTASVKDLPLPSGRIELEALPEAMASLDLSAERVPVDAALIARLPEKLQPLIADYAPAGPASLRYTFRRGAAGPRRELAFNPLGMAASFAGFPYQVTGVTGSVVARGLGTAATDIEADLTGYSGPRPVRVKGHVRGVGADPEIALVIRGDDIPLDQKLFDALGRGSLAQDAAKKFLSEEARAGGLARHPMGRADVHASITRRQGARQFDNVIHVGIKDASVLHDDFPYALKNVSGSLALYPDHWEANGFKGRHGDGEITVTGRSRQVPGRPALGEGPREMVRLAITGTNIRLDEDFEKALVPVRDAPAGGAVDRRALQRAWRGLALAGTLRFAAEVIDEPNKPLGLEFALGFDRCSMKPAFFPYPLTDVTGEVRYAKGLVSIQGLNARHGTAAVALKSGAIQPRPDGHLNVWLTGLAARGVSADSDLMGALPDGLKRGLEAVRLGPSFDVGANLILDVTQGPSPSAKVWWDGGVGFADASLRAGTDVTAATGRFHTSGHFDGRQLARAEGQLALASATVLGQPVTNISARMEIDPRSPEAVRFRNIKASLFGGTVGGEALVVTGPAPRYDLALEATGVRLEQLGRHNLGQAAAQGDLEGPVRMDLRLSGEGDDPTSLRGSGRVDVADGKMGQLPALLDIFKALGLRKPDGTAFEQLHMEYGIDGPRFLVQVLDLKGQSVSLRGGGAMNLDGSNVKLDFTAMPGLIGGWLPPPLDRIPPIFSKQLLKITMRGDLKHGGLRFDNQLVPALRGVMRP